MRAEGKKAVGEGGGYLQLERELRPPPLPPAASVTVFGWVFRCSGSPLPPAASVPIADPCHRLWLGF